MRLDAIDLRSGRWKGSLVVSARESLLELVQPIEPSNKMRVPLPDGWRALSPDDLQEHVRRPEVRLWYDDAHILWRISVVGPGTPFPYPLNDRHLVFDSERAFAGIVQFDPPAELGDLTSLELQRLRDRISDFGGRRRGYRPPA